VLLGQGAFLPILYIMCVLAAALVVVAFLLQHRERQATQRVRR
jgi:Flp pilus assembly protein TadB